MEPYAARRQSRRGGCYTRRNAIYLDARGGTAGAAASAGAAAGSRSTNTAGAFGF
jgi:hypothetical protein